MRKLLDVVRNYLCEFSGEDNALIQNCDKRTHFYFSMIGLSMLSILLCSLASALYFADYLFQSVFVDFGIGLIWVYSVGNMYVLLLSTFTPITLPLKVINAKEGGPQRLQFYFSFGLRIFLVVLLAVIIAQPLNVCLLKPDSAALAFDIQDLLSSNPRSILVTLFVMAVFLLPIYFKYRIRELGVFYPKKANIERRIIEEAYGVFKRNYREILESNISDYNKLASGNFKSYLSNLHKVNPVSYQEFIKEIENELRVEKVSKYEYWLDPPFRTILDSRGDCRLSEQDLLNHIYPEAD